MIAVATTFDIVIVFTIENDFGLLFSIEFYRIIVLIDVPGYKRILKSGLIHLLTPGAPIRVYVHKDFFLGLLMSFDGFFKSHPLYLLTPQQRAYRYEQETGNQHILYQESHIHSSVYNISNC
jgi:hypothetical protein